MIFVHFLEKGKSDSLDTYQVQLAKETTLSDFLYMIRTYRTDIQGLLTPKLFPAGEPLPLDKSVEELGLLNDNIYLQYQPIKPVFTKEFKDILDYLPLNKYSFLQEDMQVKVYVDIQGAHTLPPQNITKRFLERSFQVKVHDLKGKNYIFAVPRTQCKLNPEKSRVLVKEKRLVIIIGKVKKDDNWFSVYKTRTIGGNDDD